MAHELIENEGSGEVVEGGEVTDECPSAIFVGGPAEPGAELAIDAVGPAIGSHFGDGAQVLRKEIPFADRHAIAEKHGFSGRGVERNGADPSGLGFGECFE